MKQLAKLAVGAAMIGGLAMAATAPAEAGVHVGISVGVPVHHHSWCYYHRCGYHPVHHVYVRPAVVVGVGPYFWHGRHWHHRRFYHGYWHYY